MTRHRVATYLAGAGRNTLLAAFVVAAVAPFYWMVLTSLKPVQELYAGRNPLWVESPTWRHYTELLRTYLFPRWFANSVVVAVASTAISLALGVLAAYGVTRTASGAVRQLTRVVLVTYLVPRAMLMIPLYQLLASLRLLNSQVGLIVAYLTFTVPFSVWLLIGFFQGIPRELDEAALIDGCSRLGALCRVVLPLARPGLVAATVYTFSLAWNELLYPLVIIQSEAQKPLTVGIAALQQGDVFAWGPLMAAGTLAAVPIVAFYALIYRQVVGGVMAGAVKG